MKTILILEDNEERIGAFQKAVAALGPDFELKIWREAPTMCAECEQYLSRAALISLTYGSYPKPFDNGLCAAKFLAEARPVCPVLVHSSETDRASLIENELKSANWIVERVHPGYYSERQLPNPLEQPAPRASLR